MLSNIGKAINGHQLTAEAANLGIGTEVERDRVDGNGSLSQHPYPKGIGNEADNPWITNDFLETMSEVVTPPAHNGLDTLHYSYAITLALRKALASNEYLWPMSMPPDLPDNKDKSLLAKAAPKKRAYIEGLYHRYGVSRQTPAGVHINISLKPKVMDFLFHHFSDDFREPKDVNNYMYSIIAQGFMRYRWLLTYLFGASPVAEKNYFEDGEGPNHPIRSIRQSKYGYPTSFPVDYTSVEKYGEKIMDAVKENKIMSIMEFYGAARFKGTSDLSQLADQGVKYLELRAFDLDPTSETALKTSTLRFIKLMILDFVMSEPLPVDEVNPTLTEADKKNDMVAMEHPLDTCSYMDDGLKYVNHLRDLTNELDLGPEYLEVIDDVFDQLYHPEKTISGGLMMKMKNNSLLDYGIEQAKKFQHDGLQTDFSFNGFDKNGGNLSPKELKQGLFNGNWYPK